MPGSNTASPAAAGTAAGYSPQGSTLASFLLHPRSMQVLALDDGGGTSQPAGYYCQEALVASDGDDGDDDCCDVMYRCNDEFMDLLWDGRRSTGNNEDGSGDDAGAHGGSTNEGNMMVQTPFMIGLSSAPIPPAYNMEAAIAQWAGRRTLQMVSRMHAVVCKETSATLVVDYVFERRIMPPKKGRGGMDTVSPGGGMPVKLSDKKEPRCYLACAYYSPRRGGVVAKYARDYMAMVQRVCNRDINFYPEFLCMCVYGDGCSEPKVYASTVPSIMAPAH